MTSSIKFVIVGVDRGRRRALLAYKEALSIYKVNGRRKDVARVLAVMGKIN